MGSEAPRRSSSVPGSGVRRVRPVVVVHEKNPTARATLERLLGEAGWAVCFCDSPRQAIELVRSGRKIAAVLVDVDGGVEIAQAVRALQPRARVVFMSGGDGLPEELPGAFVKRPLDFEILQSLLAGRQGPPVRRFATS